MHRACYGGEGGIRTPDTREGMPDFESGAIDRTLPPLHFCWQQVQHSNHK